MLKHSEISRKSQIAIEYCYQFHEKYPHGRVFWVHADTIATFEQAYIMIAQNLGISPPKDSDISVFHSVSKRLSETKLPWLMILDNADDSNVFFERGTSLAAGPPLENYIPRSPKGFIIITTRDTRVGKRLAEGNETIEVQHMLEAEAEALLQSKLPPNSATRDGDTKELLMTLENLPLAITHAAAYISECNTTLAEYVRMLRKGDSEVTGLLELELVADLRRGLSLSGSPIRTWQLSFTRIREQKPQAAELLSLMAVLDRSDIPKFLLLGPIESKSLHALAVLEAFSLITRSNDEKSFTMHRLVQLATRDWLEVQGKSGEYKGQAVELLSKAFPNPEFGSWGECQSLSPHVRIVSAYSFESLESQLLHAALLYKAAWFEREQGRYTTAHVYCKHAFDIHEKLLGKDDAETLSSLSMLAVILMDQGEFNEAEKLCQQVLDARKKTLGKDHRATLKSMNDLGEILRRLGRYDDAEKTQRCNLKDTKRVLGKEDADTLMSMDGLGVILMDQGKYGVAEKLLRRALQGRDTVLGPNNPLTLASMESLAGALECQGKYQEAEETYDKVLRLYETVLGKEHSDTLSCINNLAGVFQAQKNWDEAEKKYRQVWTSYLTTLGREHPYTVTTMTNLGRVLEFQQRYDEAEQMQKEALQLSEKGLGKEHPDTLVCMYNMACLFDSKADYDKAERVHREVLRLSEKVLGERHPDTMKSMEKLAVALRKQGKTNEAEGLSNRISEIEKALDGEDRDGEDDDEGEEDDDKDEGDENEKSMGL